MPVVSVPLAASITPYSHDMRTRTTSNGFAIEAPKAPVPAPAAILADSGASLPSAARALRNVG